MKTFFLKQSRLMVTLTVIMFGIFLFSFSTPAQAAVSVTSASGGGSVSIDTTSHAGGSPAWTTLTGPVISENSLGEIGVGTHYLDLPLGWEFDTSSFYSMTINGGTNLSTGGSGYSGANRIFFVISTASSNIKGELTFSNIKVRPTEDLVSTGYITHSGAGIVGVTDGSTPFGTLTTVAGAVNKIAFTTQPSSTATAGAAFTTQSIVKSQDFFGNTRTSDINTITLSAYTDSDCTVPAAGNFNGTKTEDEVGGIANFSGNGLNYEKVETIYLQASDGTRTKCSEGIAVAPAAAETLTISTQPANSGGTVDNPLTTQPAIDVVDAYGNHVANGTVVTAVKFHGAGSLVGSNTATTINGVATFSGLGYSKSEEIFSMEFTSNGKTSGDSSDVSALTDGALYSIVVSPDGDSMTADDTKAFTAEGFDFYGNSRGDVTASTVFSDNSTGTWGGVNNATFTAVGTGSITITGTNGSITDTAPLTVTPGVVSSIVVSPDGSSMTADDIKAFIATGYDADGNATGDVTASTVFSDNSTGTWGGANNATFTAVGSGSVTITGTYTGGIIIDTTALTVTPGALASMVISSDVVSVTADSNTSFISEGFDADGNSKGMVTGGTTFSIVGGGDGGSWVGGSYTAHTAGVYVVHGVNGAITDDTTSLTVTHGVATKYVIIDPTDGTVDAPITVTIELQDQHGNLVTTGIEKDVDVRLVSGSNSYDFGVVDISNGTGSRNIYDHVAETVGLYLTDIQVTGHDVSSVQSVVFAHGIATKYVIINPTDGTVDAPIPVTVELQDQYGNLVTTGIEKDVDVRLVSGSNSYDFGVVDISNGTGSRNIYDHVAETVGLYLTDIQVTGHDVTSIQDVVFAPGAANHIQYTVQPSATVVAGVALAAQPTVVVQDQYHNVRTQSADIITLSPFSDVSCTTPGTGSLRGTLTKLETSGVADFTGQGVNYTKSGDLYLQASDGTRTVCSSVVVVSHDVANKLSLVASPASLLVGANSTLTATVQDQYGNTVTSDGTTYVTLSSDGNSIRTTQNGVVTAGVKTFTLSDNTAETVNASITSNPWLIPSAEAQVVFGGTDILAPHVDSQSPAHNETNQAITVSPTVTFSEAMDAATVNTNSVQLRALTGDSIINSVVTYTGLVATIDPVDSLSNSTSYYVWVSGAKDLAGNTVTAYTAGANQHFSTVPSTSDTTSPAITAASEAVTQNGATISFTSDEAGTTKVGYGLSATHGNMTSYVSMTADSFNSVVLTGLTCGTTYHYTIYGKDSLNNEANTADDTFTTSACTEPTEISSSASLVKRIATKNGLHADGWKWLLDVTVPTASSTIALSFDNLTGAGTILAHDNIRFYSTQLVGHTSTSTAVVVDTPGAGSAWTSDLTLSGDLSSNPGRQIQITVEAAVPVGSTDGYYSAAYDIR